MFYRICALAAVAAGLCFGVEEPCRPGAPCYSSATITSAASGAPGALAPNTLATIYGSNLSYVVRELRPDDVQDGQLPAALPGTDVYVLVGGLPAQMFYVSPTQVNFLTPATLRATEVEIQLVRANVRGPIVRMRLMEAAPALFQMDADYVIASHADFSVVTEEQPARPGRWVVFWATGLGAVTPPASYGQIPREAAWIKNWDSLRVFLDETAVEPWRIYYAGLTPGCAGLYQINLLLPEDAPPDPEVRIAVADGVSPPQVRLRLEP